MSRALDSPARAAYEHIAPFYDRFTAHHDYEAWLQTLLGAARPLGLHGRRLLDVACGTGKSFLPLARQGWEVTACDLSRSMVDQARAKAPKQVRLEVADMRSLPVFGAFDLVTCLDDSLNYVLEPAELATTFAGFRRNLARRGLVVFDVNTLRTYRTFFARTVTQRHGTTELIWRGRASAATRPGAVADATFEVVSRNGRKARPRRQLHRQRHWRQEDVERALRSAGLHALAVYGQDLDGRLEAPIDEARHTKAVFIASAE